MACHEPYPWDESDSTEWVDQPTNLTCGLCEQRVRMPGHPVCAYCHWVNWHEYVKRGVDALEKHLETYVLWSVYQAEHQAEGEANA